MFKKFIFLIIFLYAVSTNSIVGKDKDLVKVLIAGDVMFDWGLKKAMEKHGKYYPIKNLEPLMKEVNYRMVNLETPICQSTHEMKKNKSYVFKGEKDDLQLLKKLNIDLVFLGNNHIMDYGEVGMEETMQALDDYNIHYSGAGIDLKESLEPVSFIIKRSNFHIISVNTIGYGNQYAKWNTPGVAPFQLNKLIPIGRKKKKEILMLSIHWGIEYNPEPEKYQRNRAHKLIQSGYKVIIGHHPHIPQGVEKYKDGIIFYSLGNFIFGSMNQYLNHNLAAILHFSGNKLVLCELVPIFGKYQTNGKHVIKPLNEEESKLFLYEISILSKKFNTKVEIKNGRGYIEF